VVEGGLLTSGINAGDIVEPVVTMNHMKEESRHSRPVLCAKHIGTPAGARHDPGALPYSN